ncbi:MAG: 50S ribosome-binding GTPase [Gemmataceae bacterium]|nr:50S ribosome-binding GTPase [Gemmataceae bacterium]
MIRAALLSPPGRSALAVLALDGEGAFDLATRLFTRKNGQPLPAEPGRSWLGAMGDGLADEVVLTVISPTRVEVSCHGGREVVRLLLETFARHGIAGCRWEDLEPNPALRLLPHALTARTASILLDQAEGAFDREWDAGDHEALRQSVGVGMHLTTPWRVAVAGPPNAGKSSLVNALAGYQRAIVSPTPGTTRDAVRALVALDGWPIELIDTAGQRDAASPLEEAGIAAARAAIAEADLVLWVVDGSIGPMRPIGPIRPIAAPTLRVANKCDLARGDGLAVSALTGEGLETLAAVIVAALVPEPPPPGAGVPFLPDQWRRLGP